MTEDQIIDKFYKVAEEYDYKTVDEHGQRREMFILLDEVFSDFPDDWHDCDIINLARQIEEFYSKA